MRSCQTMRPVAKESDMGKPPGKRCGARGATMLGVSGDSVKQRAQTGHWVYLIVTAVGSMAATKLSAVHGRVARPCIIAGVVGLPCSLVNVPCTRMKLWAKKLSATACM